MDYPTHAAAEGRRAEDCGSGTAVSIKLPLSLVWAAWLKLPSPLLLLLLHFHFLLHDFPLSSLLPYSSVYHLLPAQVNNGLFIFRSNDPTL